MQYRIFPLGGLLAASLLSGCISGGDSRGAPASDQSLKSGEYLVSGNRIVMRLPADTIRFCLFDSLKTQILGGEPQTLEFTLQEQSLSLYPETGDSVQIHILLDRLSGGGLEGLWKVREYDYLVHSAALNDSTKDWWERFIAMQNEILLFQQTEFEFQSGRVALKSRKLGAEFFVAGWNGDFSMGVGIPDSALYDIEPRVIDSATVELRGLRNGETVTISFDGNITKTYASDNPARPTYVDGNPTSCPQNPQPWYVQFLIANMATR